MNSRLDRVSKLEETVSVASTWASRDRLLAQPPFSKMPLDLGGNLALRMARLDEAEALVEFNTRVFDDRITYWTRDLMSGNHPTVQPSDFTVVEDTHKKEIVSSLCLISQTWAYEGIPFGVGRADMVATNPEYRRRGLVRKQFDIFHALSAAKGELMQLVIGVEWFYRQFGYEMGVNQWGNRCVDSKFLSSLAVAGSEQYRLRPPTAADHSFIRELYDESIRNQRFAALRTPEQWTYEFQGRSKQNTRGRGFLIFETTQGDQLGYIQYLPCLASPQWLMFRIYQIELKRGVCYLNVAQSLLRLLWEKGQALIASGELPCAALDGIELALERDHPYFRAIPAKVQRELKPVPWYIRVPDMVAFLRRIRPALEKHLPGTVAEGYTGELKLSFFRGGIRLGFERGQMVAIDSWSPTEISSGDARLPDATFLQLVCGWRRFPQLMQIYPDCSGTDEAAVLLDCLFPPFTGKPWALA